MRASTHAVRRTTTAALVLALGLGLAACGSDDESADDTTTTSATGVRSINKAGVVAEPVAISSDSTRILLGNQADPEAGLVNVDGSLDALTTQTRNSYRTYADRTANIGVGISGETRAFQRLCVGEIDIVDSSRPITPQEWANCQQQGLDIVQFQVAADAIVLAIKSETDVGQFCMTTDQANEIFRSDTTIDNWSQVGPRFVDQKLETGGPGIQSNAFQFFGRYVLNSPEPSITNFRADYRVARDEDATREFVYGADADRKLSANYTRVRFRWLKLRKELRQAWAIWGAARDELKTALEERAKGIRTNRPPADKAKDEARVQAAYVSRGEAITAVNLVKAKFKIVDARYQPAAAAWRRLNATNGHVGLFSESYYALWESQLKPFEIELSDGDAQRDCIFPSPQTIVNGEYPLSRQLLLTTTTRALKRPEVKDFILFYLRNSQQIATDSNVIPLPNKDVQRQIDWIQDNDIPKWASIDGAPVAIVTDPAEIQPVVTKPTVTKPAR